MKIPWLVTKVILRRRTYGTIRLSRCAAGKKEKKHRPVDPKKFARLKGYRPTQPFTWIFQGIRIEAAGTEKRVSILAGGKSLVIQRVSRSEAGNYTCLAYNLEGNQESNILNIQVQCKYFQLTTQKYKGGAAQCKLLAPVWGHWHQTNR